MIFIGIALIVGSLLALLFTKDASTLVGLSKDNFAQIASLLAVLILVAGGGFGRQRLGEIIRNSVMWLAIFAVCLVGYTFRSDVYRIANRVVGEISPGTPLETAAAGGGVVFRRDLRGSFHTNGQVNGHGVSFLFDTGASVVVLSISDARRAGIDIDSLNYTVQVKTANGNGTAAPVRLQTITIGPIVRKNIRALVAEPGALDVSLLGMTFIETLSSFRVAEDLLELND